MWTCLLDWLGKLPPSSASFVGTLTGSSLGLIAILFGALFNAYLNRRRDDALRVADKNSITLALKAELSCFHKTLKENAAMLANTIPPPSGGFLVPDMTHSIKIMPHMLARIGLLDDEAIKKVINAYALIEQHIESLIIMGGQIQEYMPEHRRVIFMKADRANDVAGLNLATSAAITEAIEALGASLR